MIKFDEELFVKLYLEKYWLPWETSIECSKRCIEEGIKWTTMDEDYNAYVEMASQCIKIKNKKEKEKQIDHLWLAFWPHFIYN